MGLIQVYQNSKLGKWYANYRYNRMMRKASAILRKCAPYRAKQLGTDKNGTLRVIKKVTFNLEKNCYEWTNSKVQRGTPSNVTKPKPKRAKNG